MSVDLIGVAAPRGVTACFTTRAGGVSLGPWAGLNLGSSTGDDRAAVRENRRRLCEDLGLDPERVDTGSQVHGAEVRTIVAPTRPGRFTGGLSGWIRGDGMVTERRGIGLVVLGADCLPVLLWRGDGTRVAAAHAGWRGLLAGVLGSAVAALGDSDGAGAVIGPGVGPCCYPVDAALRARFARELGPETVAGEAVDLRAAATAALVAAGVRRERIQAVPECTSCAPERFYSYRRDGATTGRHAGVIAIAGA